MSYLIYQLKVSLLLLVFYSIYRLIINRSTLFSYKRLFILVSIFAAFVTPLLKIQINQPEILSYYKILPEVVIGVKSLPDAAPVDVQFWLIFTCSTISLIVFVLFARQLYRLVRIIRKANKETEDGFVVVKTAGNEAFTFLRYIFIGNLIPENSRETIFRHEKIHAQKLHSIDILIIDMVILVQWFNPFIWLFRKALKENHEFEADNILIGEGVSIDHYQQLLLNQMFQTYEVRFSSFNYNSFIKNRIKMMTKKKSPAGKTRFLLATVMCLFVVSVFSFKAESVKNQVKQGMVSLKVSDRLLKVSDQLKDTIKSNSNDETFYLVVDEPATFRGKDLMEFNNYLVENIKYPEVAVKNKMEGKVFVQFIVEKDGSVKDVKIIRGASPTLDEEAIRVVKSSPKWEPAKFKGKLVRQAFTLPIVFSLK